MAVSMIGPKFYAWDNDGKPLAYGKLYTYQAGGTDINKPTYQSEGGTTENSNPVILNGEGYADVYLSGSYSMVLKDANDNDIWSEDPVTSQQANEWNNCLDAAYASVSSLKVSGNQTETYTVGRRVRIDNGTGTYSYPSIEHSSYSAGETTLTFIGSPVGVGVVSICVSIIDANSTPDVLPLSFETNALLISLEPTATNTIFYCEERGAQYILKESGYTSSYGDVTFSNGRVGALQKKDNMYITQFGMVSGGYDNINEYRDVADYLNESGASVTVPSGVFETSSGVLIYRGTVTHEDGGIIRNTANISTDSRFWENTAVFFGSYFGYNATDGVNAETSYEIDPAALGDTSVTLQTASEASNFSEGDIVFIRSSETYGSTDFSTGSHVTKIREISGAVLYLRDKIKIPITSDGVTSCLIIKQTGTLTTTNTGRTDYCVCADGVNVVNGQYESVALDNSQAVHISAIDSNFNFKNVSGQSCFGINPFAHSSIDCKKGLFTLRGLEVAYFHQSVYSNLLAFSRIGDPIDSTSASIPVAFSEYGNDKNLGVITVDDYPVVQDILYASVDFLTPNNYANKLIVDGSQGGTAVSFSADRAMGTRINNINLPNTDGHGVVIDSPDVRVGTLDVQNMTDDTKYALRFTAGGSYVGNFITKNSSDEYSAYDESTEQDNIVINSSSFYSQQKVRDLSITENTGTGSLVDIKTYTIPSGSSTKVCRWKVEAAGSIPSTSINGSKNIVIDIAGTSFGISPTAPQYGYFNFVVELVKKGNNTEQEIRASYSFNDGTMETFGGRITINTLTTDIDIKLRANLNASDTFFMREWTVTPHLDQIDYPAIT